MAGAKVWRCSKRGLFWGRVGLAAFAVAGAAFVVAGLAGGIRFDAALGSGVLLLALAGTLQRFALYPSLEANPSGLIVRNPVSTKPVPWEKVGKISPGYSGLRIEVHGGSPVNVWCVQKNNWDMARGNRTRADEVIDEIAAYGAGVTRRPPGEFVESPEERADTQQSARVSVAVGMVVLAIYVVVQIIRNGA